MLPLFTLTIFLAATLLFLVQPMVGKQILPLLGGSPSVWNTVMLFFQGMLLAGYGYAHGLSGLRSARPQLIIHAGITAVALALLPIGVPRGEWWAFDPAGFAPGHVLLLLAATCAAPAFVLCSASPLLQQWFARTGHPRAHDPYFLYAASNVGSMAALLAYPIMIEPNLTLSQQRGAWSIAFAMLGMLLIACGFVASRAASSPDVEAEESSTKPRVPRPTRPEASRTQPRCPAISNTSERELTIQRLRWLALSFVPAGLMMGATQHITIDIAPVPLLWVLPLAIYLLTFILAFARGGRLIGQVCGWILPPVVVAVAVMAIIGLRTPAWLPVGTHLLMLFLAAMTCHGRLAALRPHADRLTEYYLLLSVGGVLAGIVCGITAPSIFNGIVEYPLFIVGACMLRETRPRKITSRPASLHWGRRTLDTLLWILIIAIVPFYVFMMAWILNPRLTDPASIRTLSRLTVAAVAVLTLIVLSRRWMYALAVLMLLSIPYFDQQLLGREILQIRTFFGVHRVVSGGPPERRCHQLIHGRTEHGRQWRTPPLDREPMAYFTKSGPVGDVFRELDARPTLAQHRAPQRLAVIGLGAGTFAAYGRAERDITFYEIDPVVKDIATDPDLFSYIAQSASPIDFVLGDARLTIARAADASYDLIAMDAFSSDAVPVHLISREAVATYLSKLRPGGLLLFNVSNLYIDFEPVLARLAEDAGLVGVIRRDRAVPQRELDAGKQPSAFIVLARSRENLGSLAALPDWTPLQHAPHARLWTDDYSDILSVVKWQ